jgi:6,7-dimethyl-8-ribityllumazine synthase
VVRADPAGQDKGGGAALAALHLIAISRKWAGQTKGIGFRA